MAITKERAMKELELCLKNSEFGQEMRNILGFLYNNPESESAEDWMHWRDENKELCDEKELFYEVDVKDWVAQKDFDEYWEFVNDPEKCDPD